MDRLVKLVPSITDGLEDRKHFRTVLCLLDFRAAYDQIWHDDLSVKMAHLGLLVCVIRWVLDMVRGRRPQIL